LGGHTRSRVIWSPVKNADRAEAWAEADQIE